MILRGRHSDCSGILLCVRWYLASSLSLRNLEDTVAEGGLSIDDATIYR